MNRHEEVLFALADDELIMGHRHSEWTGWAPHIEEDIAFSSIAQDEIGHANLFFKLLAEITGKTPDELALGRQPHEYRNAIICERPNGDWAYTLARHFLYEAAEKIRLEALQDSSHQPLADVCEKLLREEVYHQMHADSWFRRLTLGHDEGRAIFSNALSIALPDAQGLFDPVAEADLRDLWIEGLTGRFDEAGLSVEFVENRPVPRGEHSDDFKALWDDLTRTYREEPAATW